MERIKLLLKTAHYYFFMLVSFMLIVLSNVFLISPINNNFEAIKTYSNFSAQRISYDNKNDESDSFAFFDDNASVTYDTKSGVTFNAKVYQFLPDTKYTDKSILNKNNVIEGGYKILSQNEACISNKLADKYDLNIGDKIYVNEVNVCSIIFITNEFYKVYEADFEANESSIFLGINTLKDFMIKSYCNFDVNIGESRNNIKNIDHARSDIKIRYAGLLITVFAITTISLSLFNLLRFKVGERKAFYELYNCGVSHSLIHLINNELLYLLPDLVLSLLLIFIGNMNCIHIVIMTGSIVFSGLVHILILNYGRVKNYG